MPAPSQRFERLQRGDRRRRIEPQRHDDGQRGDARSSPCAGPARSAAADACGPAISTCMQRPVGIRFGVQQPDIGRRVGAEGQHLRLARQPRAGGRTASESTGSTATPPGSRPGSDAGFFVGDRLDAAQMADMRLGDRRDHARHAAAPDGPAARSPRHGSCRFRPRRTRRRAACAPASAARPSDCCRTRPRHASGRTPTARHAASPSSWSCRRCR